MKKKFLKLLMCIVFCGTLLLGIILGSGCYVVKGVKMKELVGTYELTRYHGKVDNIAQNNMKLYITIKSDGRGHYVYQDDDTPLHCGEMLCRFTTNDEDSSVYDYVEIAFSRDASDWHKLAINNKNLNSQKAKWAPIVWGEAPEIDYYIDVDFTKVSSKTDLSYAEEKFNTTFTVLPLGVNAVSGVYEFFYFENAEGEVISEGLETPVYAYIALNPYENKVTVYYMLKSDEVQVQQEYACSVTYNGTNFVATIGNSDNVIQWSEIRLQQTDADPAVIWVFSIMAASPTYDLTDAIAQTVADYQANKATPQE